MSFITSFFYNLNPRSWCKRTPKENKPSAPDIFKRHEYTCLKHDTDKKPLLAITAPKEQELSAPDIFKNHGYTCLKHFTNKESSLAILESGTLLAGGPLKVRKESKIFFDATKLKENPDSIEFHSASYGIINGKESGDLEKVTLIFTLNVLNHVKGYHVGNQGWLGYGKFYPGDYSSTMPIKDLDPFLAGRPSHERGCGEIVVYEERVPTTHLVGIWVHPDKKTEMISDLKDRGIETINGISVDQFVGRSP